MQAILLAGPPITSIGGLRFSIRASHGSTVELLCFSQRTAARVEDQQSAQGSFAHAGRCAELLLSALGMLRWCESSRKICLLGA